MSYIVYFKESTRYALKENSSCSKLFATEASAKAGVTRGVNTRQFEREDVVIAHIDEFTDFIEKEVERKNFMTGDTFMERVNTPHYCSPAFESYWSM